MCKTFPEGLDPVGCSNTNLFPSQNDPVVQSGWVLARIPDDEKRNDLFVLAAMRDIEPSRAGLRHVRS